MTTPDTIDTFLDEKLLTLYHSYNGADGHYMPVSEAKASIKQFIENRVKEARVDEWQKIHKPYQKGQVKGQYKILEVVKRVGKNTKFKVECIDCGLQMFRYANKFELNHKHCVVALTESKGD